MVTKFFDHEIGIQSKLMLTVIRYFISFSFIIFAMFWQGYRKRVSQLLRFRVNPFPSSEIKHRELIALLFSNCAWVL